jgi:flagellar biosynthetic protein FliR
LETAWGSVTEFALGAAMGLVVRFIVAMAEVAAEAIAPMLGLGVAQLFDAASRTNQNILTSILRYVCILVALAIGVHRLLLEALLSSFRLVPAGSIRLPAAGFGVLWALSGQVLLVGARIALPLIAILFIVQITLAFVSRAAPQLQVFSVGFAVATAVGLTTLVLVLPDVSRSFIVEFSKVSSHLERLLGDVGAAQ